MKWFRFYHEVAHDAKVQLLEPAAFKDWVNLLCLANENADDRGVLPPVKQIAYVLRTTVDDADARIAHLTGEGLFDIDGEGRYRPHNWEDRQPDSDDAAARMRKARAEARRLAKAEAKAKKSAGKQGGSEPKTDPIPKAEATCSEQVPNGNGTQAEHVRSRLEEKRIENTPPLPPKGGKNGCVFLGEPTPDAEPFHSDADSLPPEPPPRIANDPTVVRRTAATADRLFPLCDFGAKVLQLQADFEIAVLEAALFDAHASGKQGWQYIAGIYRRRLEDGRGAGQVRAAPPSRPAERPIASHPIHVAPPDSPWRKVEELARQRKAQGGKPS